MKMHPVMKVNRTIIDDKVQYELILSRANFNHLCAGCPDFDRLVGNSPGGAYFCLFPNHLGEISKSFKPMPDGQGYFANVGVPVPTLLAEVTTEDFDRLSQEADDNLEKAINESGKIPIEVSTGLKKINVGYVVMRVEDK